MTTDLSDLAGIRSISASVSRGGWECQFDIAQDTDAIGRWREVLVTWRPALAGNPPGTPRLAFRGWALPQEFQFDRAQSQLSVIARTTDGILEKGWLQGIGFADTGADLRDHYHQFDDRCRMTLARIVQHILGYYDNLGSPPATNPDWVAHTNCVYHPTQNPGGWITLAGVDYANSNRVNRYIVRETNNLWSMLQKIAGDEFYVIYFDKGDMLHYKPHPMYDPVLPAVVMEFDEDFCLVPPRVEVREAGEVRQVILRAVSDTGVTHSSYYPASPTHVYGNVEEVTGLRCNDWGTLDMWAYRHYWWLNRRYTVEWQVGGLAGLYFDLLDRVSVTYAGTASNGVHINWSEKKFWIHEIEVSPQEGNTGVTRFVLEEERLS